MVAALVYIAFALAFLVLAHVLLKDPTERVQSWVSFCTAAIFFAQALVHAAQLGK